MIVCCAASAGSGGTLGAVALAAHPGGFVRHATVAAGGWRLPALRRTAGEVLRGSLDGCACGWARTRGWTHGCAHQSPGRGERSARSGRPSSCRGWRSTGIPCCSTAEVTRRGLRGRPAPAPGRRPRLRGEELGSWLRRALVVGTGRCAFPDGDLGVAFAGGRVPLLGASRPPPPSWFGSASGCSPFGLRSRARGCRPGSRLAGGGCARPRYGSSSRARRAGRLRTSCRFPSAGPPRSRCARSRCWRAGSRCA